MSRPMGIQIAILKLRENRALADYEFSFQDRTGVLRMDKGSGRTLLIDVDPADEMVFRCATCKLRDHWSRGEFPDRTTWVA